MTFPWYEAPTAGKIQHGLQLLTQLGAIDDQQRLTPIGRRMASLPLHPRLSRMMLEGSQRGQGRTAARLAALCSEGEFLKHTPPPSIDDDLSYRFEQLEAPTGAVDQRARSAILRIAKQLMGILESPASSSSEEAVWQDLLLAGFADRLARKNDDGSYTLAAGFRAELGRRSRCRQGPSSSPLPSRPARTEHRVLRLLCRSNPTPWIATKAMN